jgi:hypothetical protein
MKLLTIHLSTLNILRWHLQKENNHRSVLHYFGTRQCSHVWSPLLSSQLYLKITLYCLVIENSYELNLFKKVTCLIRTLFCLSKMTCHSTEYLNCISFLSYSTILLGQPNAARNLFTKIHTMKVPFTPGITFRYLMYLLFIQLLPNLN